MNVFKKIKYFVTASFLFILTSCAQKYYTNESGSIRPIKKKAFSYSNRFKAFSSQIDTNAIYVYHWQYQSFNGSKEAYEYYRFFGSGQIIWSGLDSVLNLSRLDDINKGIIGRYYFKKDQLRIQPFYPVSISRSISKTYGFIKDGNIYTYRDSPETWYGSYSLTRSFSGKHIQEWKRQATTFRFTQKPDW